MVRGKDERADFEWIEALRATERADDDLVEQRPRPQEKSAVDRAAGHLVQGSPIGRESDLPGHFGSRVSQEPCQARHVESNYRNRATCAERSSSRQRPDPAKDFAGWLGQSEEIRWKALIVRDLP